MQPVEMNTSHVCWPNTREMFRAVKELWNETLSFGKWQPDEMEVFKRTSSFQKPFDFWKKSTDTAKKKFGLTFINTNIPFLVQTTFSFP